MKRKAMDETEGAYRAMMEEVRQQPPSSLPPGSLHPAHAWETGTTVQALRPVPKLEGNTRADPDVTVSFCMKQLKKPPAQGLDYKRLASSVNTQKPQALDPSSLDQYL